MASQRAKNSDGKLLRDAFQTYVRLARDIPQVVAVVARDGNELSLTSVIPRRNVKACARLFRVEQDLYERFPKAAFSFDIVYGQGRPLDEIVDRRAPWRWVRDAEQQTARVAS
jgi:hypothetical protein